MIKTDQFSIIITFFKIIVARANNGRIRNISQCITVSTAKHKTIVKEAVQLSKRVVEMAIKTRRAHLLMAVLFAFLVSCGPTELTAVPTAAVRTTPVPPTATSEATHVLALVDTQTRSRDGMTMVYVPAGQFEMGMSGTQADQTLQVCNEVNGDCEREWFRDEQPAHTVALDAFWIDQTEVTNAQFVAFLNEQGNQVEEGVSWLEPGAGTRGIVYGHIEQDDGVFHPSTGYEDYPVIEVSWYGAVAYCAWVGGRLPTEAEWEYAARGPDGSMYPWGDTFDGARVNYCDASCFEKWRDIAYNDGYAKYAPVGSYPGGASWCGALDMVGNVWEWVNDWYSSYAHSPVENPQGPVSGTYRIMRGGSWYDERWRVCTAERKGSSASSYRMHWVGFRCVVSAHP